MLLGRVASERGHLALEVTLLEGNIRAVREVEVVPRDLVSRGSSSLEGAQALVRDRLVILVDVVVRRLEDDVRAPIPPTAQRGAPGCPGAAPGRS